MSNSYLVDVLTLNSREKGSDAAVLSLNTNGGEESLDVVVGGGGIATGIQQKVSSEVFHFLMDCFLKGKRHPSINPLAIYPDTISCNHAVYLPAEMCL